MDGDDTGHTDPCKARVTTSPNKTALDIFTHHVCSYKFDWRFHFHINIC